MSIPTVAYRKTRYHDGYKKKKRKYYPPIKSSKLGNFINLNYYYCFLILFVMPFNFELLEYVNNLGTIHVIFSANESANDEGAGIEGPILCTERTIVSTEM